MVFGPLDELFVEKGHEAILAAADHGRKLSSFSMCVAELKAISTSSKYHLSWPSVFDGNCSSMALKRARASSSVGSGIIGISLVVIVMIFLLGKNVELVKDGPTTVRVKVILRI